MEKDNFSESEKRKSPFQQSDVATADDSLSISDDVNDLQLDWLQALEKQSKEPIAGPAMIARLIKSGVNDTQDSTLGYASSNDFAYSEIHEFVWGLKLDGDAQKANHVDVFVEGDGLLNASKEELCETSHSMEVIDSVKNSKAKIVCKEENIVVDEILHETPIGKGLSGAHKWLRDRGVLEKTVEWSGRSNDRKKSKLGRYVDGGGTKEIHLRRVDKNGEELTPKQAYLKLCYRFHSKWPSKNRLEKRMKLHQVEQKRKQLTSLDASVDRMKKIQNLSHTPYIVLDGRMKPAQLRKRVIPEASDGTNRE